VKGRAWLTMLAAAPHQCRRKTATKGGVEYNVRFGRRGVGLLDWRGRCPRGSVLAVARR
jgi:hypothetical protein